jgi:BlaI family penicillinase repressor
MARAGAITLTDHELSIMRILWKQAPLSVQEILDVFPRSPKPAYTSLLTAVRSMEKKGILAHKKESKAYLYRPLLQQVSYKRSALKRLLANVFDGDACDLAANLVKAEPLDATEVEQIKRLLEDL